MPLKGSGGIVLDTTTEGDTMEAIAVLGRWRGRAVSAVPVGSGHGSSPRPSSWLLAPAVAPAEDAPPHYSADELDEMVAPIALYPDPILSQVMTASAYPDQVKAADEWAEAHKGLQGDALAQAMSEANFEWDASVQALVPFPTVLETMTRDLGTLERLGNAVLAQRGDVMDSVQRMRKKAHDAGNLKSSEQITVTTPEPTVIEIQPANPQVIYVPVYDPAVVYAPPPPASSGGNAAAAAVFGFIAGVAVAEMFDDDWYGGCGFGWSSHTVVIHNSAWGCTWSNRHSYHPPYPARPVYVNRDVNINTGDVNIGSGNVNIDHDKNVDRSKNVDRGDKTKIDADHAGRGEQAGTRPAAGTSKPLDATAKPGLRDSSRAALRRSRPQSIAKPASTDAKGKTAPGTAARGYERTPTASSKSAMSGSTHGKSEAAASKRGRSSSGGAHASSSHSGGAAKRGGR